MNDPGPQHLRAIKRIFRYLYGTKNISLIFIKNSEGLQLEAYSDADFAGDRDTRRSTSGYIVLFGGNIIVSKSQRQKSVSLSTCEAELHSLTSCAKEVVYLRRLLGEIKMKPSKPTLVHVDNAAAIAVAKKNEFSSKLKHSEINQRWLNELIERLLLTVEFISTEKQLADVLTKPLLKAKFEPFRLRLRLISD